MNGWLPAAGPGIVKTWQIVMHKAGAMHELQRHGGGIRNSRLVIAAGDRHRQANFLANVDAAGSDRAFARALSMALSIRW